MEANHPKSYLCTSMSSSQLLLNVNTETSIDWRTDRDSEEEEAFVSWPVYEYTYSGTVQLLLLFIHKHQDFVLIDAFNSKVKYKFPLRELEKMSYDENITPGINPLLLFRVTFRPNNVNIFLSKDRNEIINHIIYSYRKENPIIQELIPQYATATTLIHNNEQPHNLSTQDIGNNHTLSKAYSPKFYHAYHEYQVFGVDLNQKLHTHRLGLYPDTIRHFESESKEVFSQHTYLELKDVAFIGENKICISYMRDNSYTFIVSDRNRDEIIMLVKGRAFLWRNIIAQEQTLDSLSQKSMPKQNIPSEQLNFPKRFTYPDKDGIRDKHSHEIETQTDVVSHMNTSPSERTTPEPSTHIRFIKTGSYLYKHVRKTISKNKSSTYHERYFRVAYDKNKRKILLQWGPSSSRVKQSAVVIGISSSPIDTTLSCSKLSKRLTDHYSFEITLGDNQKLFLVAKDSLTYQHWIEGLGKMIKRLIEIINLPSTAATAALTDPFDIPASVTPNSS